VDTVDAGCSRELGRGLGNSWADTENPEHSLSVFKKLILINRESNQGYPTTRRCYARPI
jgi:hypothetical protein